MVAGACLVVDALGSRAHVACEAIEGVCTEGVRGLHQRAQRHGVQFCRQDLLLVVSAIEHHIERLEGGRRTGRRGLELSMPQADKGAQLLAENSESTERLGNTLARRVSEQDIEDDAGHDDGSQWCGCGCGCGSCGCGNSRDQGGLEEAKKD